MRDAPRLLIENEIYNFINDITNFLGKLKTTRRRSNAKDDNWKKRSIFLMPYWNDLLLRYSLDVLHDEKNVYNNNMELYLT